MQQLEVSLIDNYTPRETVKNIVDELQRWHDNGNDPTIMRLETLTTVVLYQNVIG